MAVQIVNAIHTIDSATETNYSIRQEVDKTHYPQVHDFYEIDLVTMGCLQLTVCGKLLELSTGNLLLIRPGDVHSKAATEPCCHINLAFPAETVKSLFEYLYDAKTYSALLSLEYCPPIALSGKEQAALQQKMERLRMISPYKKAEIKTNLRFLLAEVMRDYLIHPIHESRQTQKTPNLPLWFKSAVQEMESVENLAAGMDFLIRKTERTKEHISRTFKRIWNITPSAYINALRLNYVANMLVHSDIAILDLAYDAGFQSISYFYQLFKLAFHTTPQKFREECKNTSPVNANPAQRDSAW